MNIINATPHDIALPCSLFKSAPIVVGHGALSGESRGGVPCYIIPPSGWRLPARAVTIGDDPTSVTVAYRQTEEMLRDLHNMRTELYATGQGVRWLVVASEISCRALDPGLLHDGQQEIELRYPVLAHESLRLPPGQRWCSALAKHTHKPAGISIVQGTVSGNATGVRIG